MSADRRLVWHGFDNGADVYLTSTDDKGADAVHLLTVFSPAEAMELFRLLDANLGNCLHCGEPLFLSTAGFCGSDELPFCGCVDHYDVCRACADEQRRGIA